MRDFHFPGRSSVYATDGMCATSHPLAAQVAIETLKKGGNAVDAAIAGAVVLGICEPQMTGIGGDLFALVHPAPGKDIVALNGSGRAPAALSADTLRENGDQTVPLNSPHAVTIPGAIDAFCTLSNDYGKLGLADVLAPAIHYAEIGVPVAPRVAFDWALAVDTLNPTAQKDFLFKGQAPKSGELFRAPKQANVLKEIAKNGRAGFYEGAIAEDMVTSLNALGGLHTLDDFVNNQPTYETPLYGNYKNIDVVEHPPNGQGATAHLMLNMLSEFDIQSMDPFGSQRAHLEAEITKLAYDARNRFLADADHVSRLDHMTSQSTAKKLANLVKFDSAMASPTALSEAVHKDTIYITVVDKDRMAVSLIYSIFHSFGSGIASEKYGVLFQNRGAGFTLEKDHPNELAPNKRPMHTIIPGMIAKNGGVKMAFGVMGGAYQPCGHARFVSNMVDFDLDSQTAIDAPRSFAENSELKVERGYSEAVRSELSELGHTVVVPDGPIGGAQSILIREDGVLKGASDPRKDGCALGY